MVSELVGSKFQELARQRRVRRDGACATVSQNIDGAIGPDTNIPDPTVQVSEQRFLRYDLVVDEGEAIEHHAGQATYQDASPPLRKQIPVIESEARGRDYGVPIIHGLFHTLFVRDTLADSGARIVNAVGDDRPSVILAPLDDVQLVAAAGPVLGFP